jgi:hypothetical protein
MAVQFIRKTKRYIGLSTDTKPTSSDVSAGSTFHETNTGKHYVYNGASWVEDITWAYAIGEAI